MVGSNLFRPSRNAGNGSDARQDRLASLAPALRRGSRLASLRRPPCRYNGVSRRGGRVVEGARLESVYGGNSIAGSNPAPSAIILRISVSYG